MMLDKLRTWITVALYAISKKIKALFFSIAYQQIIAHQSEELVPPL